MTAPQAGLVFGCAIVCAALKMAGPVFLGGRDMPAPLARVVALLAPALMAALVVTHTFADGARLKLDAMAPSVAVGMLVTWRSGSEMLAVAAAAATAALAHAL